MPFAKLYETKEHGQILAKLDTNADGNPSVKFYCEPEGFGVCSVGPGWDDNDEGWDKAEAFFETVDEGVAIKHATVLKEDLRKMMLGA